MILVSQPSRAADVVIIGGGIIGLSVAFRLQQEKMATLVLDRQQPGREASYAGAGMIAPKFEPATAPFAKLAIASRDGYADFCAELAQLTGVNCEYRDEGTVMPLLDDEEEAYASEILTSAGDSVPLSSLTAREVLDFEPDLSPEVRRGIFIPGDHQVNNRRLVRALVLAVERLGGEIHVDTPVKAIRLHAGKVDRVDTERGPYTAGKVVLAAGCWSHQIDIDDPSLRPPTRPVKGQMLALQSTSCVHLTHNIHSPRCYLVPRLDGRIEVGSTVEDVGFDKTVTAGAMEKLLRAALSVAPKLRDCAVIETWAGLRPGSPDLHPIVGKTDVEGLLMATGNYRSGLLMAPIIGKLMAELILTDQTPQLFEPFPLSRFKDHEDQA